MKKILLISIAFLLCSCTAEESTPPHWKIIISGPKSIWQIEDIYADSTYIYPDGRLYFESEYFSGTVKKGYYSLRYFN